MATAVEGRRPEAILVVMGRTTLSTVATLAAVTATVASRRPTARRARPLPIRLLELPAAAIHITGRGRARRTLRRRPTWRRPCMRGLQERMHAWRGQGSPSGSACGRHVWEQRVSTPVTRQVSERGAARCSKRCTWQCKPCALGGADGCAVRLLVDVDRVGELFGEGPMGGLRANGKIAAAAASRRRNRTEKQQQGTDRRGSRRGAAAPVPRTAQKKSHMAAQARTHGIEAAASHMLHVVRCLVV